MYFVYIIRLIDGDYCTGSTSNLDKRVCQHNSGCNSSTKNKRPVELIRCADFHCKSYP